jgi:hypothetical protein
MVVIVYLKIISPMHAITRTCADVINYYRCLFIGQSISNHCFVTVVNDALNVI